ncbi:synaptotagmin-1-like [Bidens hawaiensis]|uniref:synaptotagmin-1-like n=1 Tax=Bidens hawaiensis TaxID=980011 RepID=UPI00404AD775
MNSKSEDVGLLVVKIHQGVNLKVKHPLVVLQVGPELKHTTPKFNDQNPIWEETFRFTLEKPAEAMLHVIVCSMSRMDKFLHKNMLGVVDLRIADVVKEKNIYSISNFGNGQVHMELQLQHATSGALIS